MEEKQVTYDRVGLESKFIINFFFLERIIVMWTWMYQKMVHTIKSNFYDNFQDQTSNNNNLVKNKSRHK